MVLSNAHEHVDAARVVLGRETDNRPSRAPDYRTEAHALAILAEELAKRPHNLFRKLAETLVESGLGSSAGVSLFVDQGGVTRLRWVALAGEWSRFVDGTVPIDADCCSVAIERRSTLLVRYPRHRFHAAAIDPAICESLLVPVHVDDRPVGVLRLNAHDRDRKYDCEDLRILESLARFAAAGYRLCDPCASAHSAAGPERQRLEVELVGMRRLYDLQARLVAEADLESAMEDIVAAACEFMGTDRGSLYLVPEVTGRAETAAWRGFDESSPFLRHMRAGGFAEAHDAVRRLGGRLVVEDVARFAGRADAGARDSALADGIRATQATPVLGRDGELIGVLCNQFAQPRRPSDAALRLVDGLAWTTADFVERRRAHLALKNSEERFRALASAGSYVIYRMSPDWAEMRELDGRAVLSDTVEPTADWSDSYIPDEDRPAVLAAIGRAIAARSVFELEHRVRRADGSVGWVLSRAVPILGAGGEIIEWFGAASDVTPRREAQEKLRLAEATYRGELENRVRQRTAELKASRDLLQGTMDASIDMIQVFRAVRNDAGEVVDFDWILNNRTSVSLYGEVHGESLLTRNPGVVVAGIFDVFKRVTETGMPEEWEHHYAHEQFNGWFYQTVVRLNDGVLTTTKEISDWKRAQAEILRLESEAAQARLSESEDRYRTLLEAIDQGFCIIEMIFDPEGRPVDYRFLEVNGAFEHQTGLIDVVGRTMREMAPEHEAHWFEFYGRIAITGESERFENHASSLGGRWYEVNALRVGAPEERRVAILFNDVSQRKRQQDALRESEARFRQFGEASSDILWIRDAGTLRWTYLTPAFEAIYGLPRETALVGNDFRHWLQLILPEDRERVLDAMRRVRSGERVSFDYRIRRPSDGEVRWLRDTDFPMPNDEGKIGRIGGVGRDITDEKATAERMKVLVAELQHRTRNLMAVVRSIARQTMASTGPTAAFTERFNDRLSALSRVQGLLSRSEAEPITIEALIRAELEALGGLAGDDGSQARISLSGPVVRLRNTIVQTFALALHELATNARKYGALSGGTGALSVSWTVREAGDDGAPRRLLLEWVETGVGAGGTGAWPDGGGYGRQLIEKALPYALGATTSFDLSEAGLRCTIDLPLEKRVRRER